MVLKEIFLQALITGIFALLAGWFGARWGMREYKQRKLIDARQGWYIDMSQNFADFISYTSMKNDLFDINQDSLESDFMQKITEKILNTVLQYANLFAQAELYATQSTFDVLRALNHEMNTLTDALKNQKTALNASEKLVDKFKIAKRFLARDLREQLGLEKLSEHTDLPV